MQISVPNGQKRVDLRRIKRTVTYREHRASLKWKWPSLSTGKLSLFGRENHSAVENKAARGNVNASKKRMSLVSAAACVSNFSCPHASRDRHARMSRHPWITSSSGHDTVEAPESKSGESNRSHTSPDDIDTLTRCTLGTTTHRTRIRRRSTRQWRQ